MVSAPNVGQEVLNLVRGTAYNVTVKESHIELAEVQAGRRLVFDTPRQDHEDDTFSKN